VGRPEEDVVVISDQQEVYVWKPEKGHEVLRSNTTVERLKSFLRPISDAMRIFSIGIEGYIPDRADALWLNPKGAGVTLERGEIARLKKSVPARVKSETAEFDTSVKFKFRLTRPGTADALICSGESEDRAELVEKDVTLDCHEDFIEEKAEAGENPLLQR
jgi:hypothetical protein